MRSVLVFRTDRVGDFLISQIFINALKKKFYNCNIDIVCSNKNFNFVSNFTIFQKVFLYPENFLEKIKFYFSIIFSYDAIIVMDGKKRSIFNTIFSFSKNKILFTPSKFNFFFYYFFFDKIFFIDYKFPIINFLSSACSYFKFNLEKNDLNLVRSNTTSLSIYKKYLNNYIIFNFDEKWFFKNYIRSYSCIQPNQSEFISFLDKMTLITNDRIVIINGLHKSAIFDYLKLKSIKITSKFYIYKKNQIFLFDSIDLFQLQKLISEANLLITCHGAPSHLASAYSVPLIDIIDNSEISIFSSYSYHFRNRHTILRFSFNTISKTIL